MTVFAYYRWCSALPIALPLLTLPDILLYPQNGLGSNTVTFLLNGSLIFGGVPYITLAILLFRWLQGKTETQIRRMALVTPLLMLPISWVCWGLYSLIFDHNATNWGSNSWYGNLFWYAYLSVFVLIIGYFYVALVHTGLFILRRLVFVE